MLIVAMFTKNRRPLHTHASLDSAKITSQSFRGKTVKSARSLTIVPTKDWPGRRTVCTMNESQSDLLERYRSNNCDLALALNEMKSELFVANHQLLKKNRELQAAHEENVTLKRDLAQCQAKLAACSAMVFDMVQTNTKKYTDLMAVVGLLKQPPPATSMPPPQPSTSTTPRLPAPSTAPPLLDAKNAKSETRPPTDATSSVTRRRRHSSGSPHRLANLTEESIANTSDALTSPPKAANVTARRREQSPPRKRTVRSDTNTDPRPIQCAASSSSNESLDSQDGDKENVRANASGRPSRRTAPKNLAEPKLTTKMRRN